MKITQRLFTRKEVIDIWLEQLKNKPEFGKMLCCPNCRDLLFDHKDTLKEIIIIPGEYYCHNDKCNYYNIPLENSNE
jgi:uncharacterized protein YbaR (Trm112 family)